MIHTKESLNLVEEISKKMDGNTFHHHYYILLDIANTYPDDYNLNYVEIGCYCGGSACLMTQRKNTNIISIDLGHPISPNIPIKNINLFNKYNNMFEYIIGNSKNITTINELKNYIEYIDILFIDGDHSFNGVREDFFNYSTMVKNGGYIIFDDYNDYEFSPEVKVAVDEILTEINGYEIIGTLDNEFNARPENLKNGNCFIIRKI